MGKWVVLAVWIFIGGYLAASASNEVRKECGEDIKVGLAMSIYAFWPQYLVSSWFIDKPSERASLCSYSNGEREE